MRGWLYNGNLALAESRESYCLFSQRTLLSNIFTTTKIAEASKQASLYLNKGLLPSAGKYSGIILLFSRFKQDIGSSHLEKTLPLCSIRQPSQVLDTAYFYLTNYQQTTQYMKG